MKQFKNARLKTYHILQCAFLVSPMLRRNKFFPIVFFLQA
jgi:hypothetical protein